MPQVLSATNIVQYLSKTPPEKRGINIYHMGELTGVSGVDRSGQFIQTTIQQPYYSLTIIERLELFRRVDMIHGVVTSRMNRVSGLEWQVTMQSKEMDRLESELKQYKQIWEEYEDYVEARDIRVLVMRQMLLKRIRTYLPDLRPDLGNFDMSMVRWRKRLKDQQEDKSSQIEDWMREPNQGETFKDFTKKSVFDLLVHGSMSWYKEPQEEVLENIYVLPGGTCMPIHNRRVGGPVGYAQVFPSSEQTQIFFADELAVGKYEPNSAMSYGTIPLEALVNKMAESLLFDEFAANQADGTKPPEKIVVFGENAPFGDLDTELEVPVDETEQKKIETVINEARKFAVRTITGVGTPTVLDISKSDTFGQQSTRQQQIRESVALVFNVSNMEVNLTGGEGTSGRSTSESQERQDQKRGIEPILGILEDKWNREIIPMRFGPGFEFSFGSGLSEVETIELDTKKAASGVYSVNEVREDRGVDPFPEDEFDRPQKGGAQRADPGADQMNPLFTSPI